MNQTRPGDRPAPEDLIREARAEFRVFGQNVIETVSTAMWQTQARLYKIRRSSETYVISRHTSEVNVKIRDGLLNLKVQLGLTEQGYEIFLPKGRYSFPLSKKVLATVLEALGSTSPAKKSSCSMVGFLELADSDPDLAVVEAEKIRYGFSVDEVICEYAEVLFNGARIETACVESGNGNYQAMQQIIGRLSLGALPNTNYLKAAKRIIGMPVD